MEARAEPVSLPVSYVGVGAQEALEVVIGRAFRLYDRLMGKIRKKTPPEEEPSAPQEKSTPADVSN